MESLEDIKKLPRKERKELFKKIKAEYLRVLTMANEYRPDCFGIEEQTTICLACVWKNECKYTKEVK